MSFIVLVSCLLKGSSLSLSSVDVSDVPAVAVVFDVMWKMSKVLVTVVAVAENLQKFSAMV